MIFRRRLLLSGWRRLRRSSATVTFTARPRKSGFFRARRGQNASSEAQIEELARERDLQARVAAERLSVIDALTHDWQESVEDQRATELELATNSRRS